MRTAAESGSLTPPLDLRFFRKGVEQLDRAPSKSAVISFLQGIYDSVAETLPDARDDVDPCIGTTITLPEMEDQYAKFGQISEKLDAQKKALETQPGLKPRKRKKSVCLDVDRTDREERFLPPGHMVDYFEQFKLACPEEKVSFSCFWRTWYASFNHMKFRSHSSHSVCSVCVRHKLLIHEMSAFFAAREKQRLLFSAHLKSQYRDRTLYWELRGMSRMRNNIDICCIIDSMDQQKFCYPRGPIYQSKELASLIRPRAHITCVLVHGYFVLFTIAEHNLPKNASCMVETLSYCLELLRTRHFVDTSRVKFSVQSDNTVRECKNNICLRWLSSITANGSTPMLQ